MSLRWRPPGMSWLGFGKRIYEQIGKDRVLGQAGQLSFYFLLSIFPLLLFLTSLLGLFLQSGPVLHEVLQKYLRAMAPESALRVIDTTLREITSGSSGGKLSFGLLGTLWAASSGMVAIIEALNIAYEVKEARRWWKRRLVALALTIGYLGLLLAALLLLLYGPKALAFVASHLGLAPLVTFLGSLLEWLLVVAFVLTAFNILYVYAPNVKHHRWHWLMPGTVVGVVLWFVVSFGFKLYLHYFNRYTATYGSIGAVIILLLWLYFTGIALLIGGEVNSEIEKSAGNVKEQSPE